MGLFGRKKSTPVSPISDDTPLSNEIQMSVATEQALLSALEMIVFHREAWNELVEHLEDMGVNAHISAEATEQYTEMNNRLRASLTVLSQESSIASELSIRLEMND